MTRQGRDREVHDFDRVYGQLNAVMDSFLELPLEIREYIYAYTVTSPLRPPESPPSATSDENRTRRHRKANRSTDIQLEESANRYLIHPPHPTGLSLLLCNRQVHNEVSTTISRLARNKRIHYELDCDMVNQSQIYPTWTLLPIYLHHVPLIYANFRLTGVCRRGSRWISYQGEPCVMAMSIMALLTRFIERGPHFLAPKKGVSLMYSVDNIIMNIETPILEPGKTLPPPRQCGRFIRAKVGPFVHPKEVINVMTLYLERLLNGEVHYALPYGRFIATRVKKIQLCLDSEEHRTWDLTALQYLH